MDASLGALVIPSTVSIATTRATRDGGVGHVVARVTRGLVREDVGEALAVGDASEL